MAALATAMTIVCSLPGESARAAAPLDNEGHLYSIDGWGGIHPQGASPTLSSTGYWSGWDIARGMSLLQDGSGGYSLDGWGGVHNIGSAPPIADASHAYWYGWDIARGIQLAPWATANAPAGWTLDGWGGVHEFGGAPAVSNSSHAYWSGWDIARGFVVFPDSAPGTVRGYILDGWGGLHGFAGGGAAVPPDAHTSAYWNGWDIARSVALLPQTDAGYMLDGWGGLHPFAPPGQALPPAVASGGYWYGWDIARSVTTWTGAGANSPGGWTMDGWGGFHPFGSAPAVAQSGYWYGWDIARGSTGAGSGSGGKPPISTRTLNVPYYGQVYALSCEEAALQMGLAYQGISATQGDILNAIGIDYRSPTRDSSGFHWGDPYANFVGNPNGSEDNYTGYGTYYSTIAAAATRFAGHVVSAGEGISPASVYNYVLNGHPVVAWISYDYAAHQNTGYTAFDGRYVQFGAPYEHAEVVIGVNPTSVLVNDPARGQSWITKSTFETAFAVFNHMAVVLN